MLKIALPASLLHRNSCAIRLFYLKSVEVEASRSEPQTGRLQYINNSDLGRASVRLQLLLNLYGLRNLQFDPFRFSPPQSI